MSQIGRIEQVELREVWDHEAREYGSAIII